MAMKIAVKEMMSHQTKLHPRQQPQHDTQLHHPIFFTKEEACCYLLSWKEMQRQQRLYSQ
eukprot:11326608-Ditylum_brightwellii.AAC.1